MKKLLLIPAILLGLSACSSPEAPQLNISPKPTLAPIPLAQGQALKLESDDLRTAQFVAIIDNGDKDVQPIHASTNLRAVLEGAVKEQLTSQGFNLMGDGNATMRIELIDALVNVDDGTFSHRLQTNVETLLTLEAGGKKFRKRYNGKSTTEGSSGASTEDMELALNTLLESVLRDMANDKQLNQFMKENL